MAVNILYGQIPSLGKAEYRPRVLRPKSSSDLSVDLSKCAPLRPTITDRVLVQDRDRPAAEDPKKIGIAIPSENTRALELAVLQIVQEHHRSIFVVAIARERGQITGDES